MTKQKPYRLPTRSRSLEAAKPTAEIDPCGCKLEILEMEVMPSPKFRKMKPRVGSQYQTKVPKTLDDSPYASSRPAPSLMSAEYDHVAAGDVSDHVQDGIRPEESSCDPCDHDELTESTTDLPLDQTMNKRGGTCVHRSSNSRTGTSTASYLYRANLLLNPHSPESTLATLAFSNETFCQEMISKYGSTQNTRRKKRRLTEQTEEWTPCHALTANPDFDKADMEGEDQEALLTHLQTRYNGHVEPAELQMRVQLSHGVACKSRRSSLLKLQKDRFKKPSIESSASWRQRLESTATMMGTLRADADTNQYPCEHPSESTVPEPIQSSTVDDEDMKGVWRSILVYGQAMERATSPPHGVRPCLTEVMNFLLHCHALPIPELYFGNRHVCVAQLSELFNSLLDHVSKARDVLAEVMDCLADDDDGVEVEALSKLLDSQISRSPLVLKEEAILRRQVNAASEWQERVDTLLATIDVTQDEDRLVFAEELANEARSFGVRIRGLVLLEKRIQKAHQLEERLCRWDCSAMTNTVKSVAGLVRDANRINLPSRQVQKLLMLNKELESWVDRANIAVRSRISLSEIESLINRAEAIPLNLSEFLDKLQCRVKQARSWIERLESCVSCCCKELDATTESNIDLMMHIRSTLADDGNKTGSYNFLLDLASEGVRIPVEVNCMKMLQIEIDSKNWMQKAEKWVPGAGEAKRGKIDELRDHLVKADRLRDRLPFEEKNRWFLNHEADLRDILRLADNWLEEFQPLLESDSKKKGSRSCISIAKLRQIVSQGLGIHANIGNSVAKMTRVLEQAESWFEKNEPLLIRSGVLKVHGKVDIGSVTLTELTNAASAASSNIPLELEEAVALEQIVCKIQSWVDRTGNAAPIKRSKRVGKGRWSCKPTRFRVIDLQELIEEAKTLPIPTEDEVQRLKNQLDEVHAWRVKARNDLRGIAISFDSLRSAIQSMHGAPEDFYGDRVRPKSSSDGEDECLVSTADTTMEPECIGDTEMAIISDSQEAVNILQKDSDLVSESASQTDVSSTSSENDLLGHVVVEKAIATMLHEGQKTGVMTSEEEVVSDLEVVSKWCSKSLKYLVTPNGIYEKKTYQHFNALVEAGRELLESTESMEWDIDEELAQCLRTSWSLLVKEQLHRLGKLRAHRDAFLEWSKTAQTLMSAKDKKLTFRSIENLAEESLKYPASADIVQRVQNLSRRVAHWKQTVNSHISTAEKKLTMNEAKSLCEEGDKLKLSCNELKVLRNAIKSARSWCNRAKKCKVEQGGTAANEVESLIDEHNDLLVAMPEEVNKLKQAMKGYCLCRRPYEGFMIGCDGCDEWYHGACIGVSESQADRYDKYLCVRCCVSKIFYTSSSSVACTIRKWTSEKDRKKARQADYQKHQRKVRKEKKDIEKSEAAIVEGRQQFGFRDERLLVQEHAERESANREMMPVATTVDMHCSFVQELKGEENAHSAVCTLASDAGLISTTKEATYLDQHGTERSSNIGPIHDIHMASAQELFTCKQPNPETCKLPGIDERNVALARLRELEQTIGNCRDRLEILNHQAAVRFETERQEELRSEQLKSWCIRVRSHVLVPTSQERADRAMPHHDGSLSAPMLDVFKDAEALGIDKFHDVHLVANSFKCIAWSCLAMTTLARRPSVKEIEHILCVCSSLTLPDEKATRMLKSMVQRTNQWQLKARKALMPRPEETQPFDIDLLRNLELGASGVPFEVPEVTFLANAIYDKGCRHCICGGSNDGSFMLGCDKCEKWFHGRCVGVSKHAGNVLEHWLCPSCCGTEFSVPQVTMASFESIEIEDDESSLLPENAQCAPTIEKLWPPFKLLGSPESLEALGEVCLTIPDSFGNSIFYDQPTIVEASPNHLATCYPRPDGHLQPMATAQLLGL